VIASRADKQLLLVMKTRHIRRINRPDT
jgi:hypothetical protein